MLSSESSLGISRRFNWLSQYCLIESQNELTELEEELKLKVYGSEEHDQLVGRIRKALLGYSDLAHRRYRFLQYEDPESMSYNCILTWLQNTNPIGVDNHWIFKEDDLMVLDPRQRGTPLGNLIGAILTLIPRRLFRWLHVCQRTDQRDMVHITVIS